MNWYKTAQQKDNWIITKLVAMFGTAVIGVLLGLNGLAMRDLPEAYESNPQQVVQQLEQIQQEQIQQEQIQTVEPIQEDQPPVAEQQESTGDIDLNKIWQIESTSGQDPKMHKPNSSGALGHFQFLEGTWNEMIGKMGKDWDWKTGALDYNKSKAVADYYFNKRIPSMLKHYRIPDTIKTRIACYSWGVGHLNKAYEKYGESWKNVAPQETKDYFVKYGVE